MDVEQADTEQADTDKETPMETGDRVYQMEEPVEGDDLDLQEEDQTTEQEAEEESETSGNDDPRYEKDEEDIVDPNESCDDGLLDEKDEEVTPNYTIDIKHKTLSAGTGDIVISFF